MSAEVEAACSESQVICGVRVASCECVLPLGHAGDVHVCDSGCGGSWRGTDDDHFVPVTFPTGIPRSGRIR